jgi:hypothetical protein
MRNLTNLALITLVINVLSSFHLYAQDLEPRRWTPIPLGLSVIGIGVGHTSGDIIFDPVMLVDDAELDLNVLGVSYVTSFKLFNKLARFDFTIPVATGKWEGLLNGEQTKLTREGLLDPKVRLSINLIGTPPSNAKEMKNYLTNKKSNTVVGAAIAISLPLGEYYSEKLINLGENRFSIRPQIGVVHTDGNWSYELTGSVFIYTDNDNFYKNQRREQKPLYAIQSHLIYNFNAGKWLSLSAGYGVGGQSKVGSNYKNDKRHTLLSSLSFGMPLSRSQAVKIGYLNGKTNSSTGINFNSLFLTFSQVF